MRIVEVEDFATADELVTALHPLNVRWQPSPEEWLFRGHADCNWQLRPSAFRPESWNRFGRFDPTSADEEGRSRRESALLLLFASSLDRVGLLVPGVVRGDIDTFVRHWTDMQGWLMPPHIELVALAQHHGIPTRLLDFTEHGLIAAYFSAHESSGTTANSLCVWAIDSRFIDGHGRCVGETRLQRATAARVTNPNLHAQAGVFVTWSHPELVSLDHLVDGLATGAIPLLEPVSELNLPVMRKLTLPRSQATRLMELLYFERITGATLFPGPNGVVKGIEESIARGALDGKLGKDQDP